MERKYEDINNASLPSRRARYTKQRKKKYLYAISVLLITSLIILLLMTAAIYFVGHHFQVSIADINNDEDSSDHDDSLAYDEMNDHSEQEKMSDHDDESSTYQEENRERNDETPSSGQEEDKESDSDTPSEEEADGDRNDGSLSDQEEEAEHIKIGTSAQNDISDEEVYSEQNEQSSITEVTNDHPGEADRFVIHIVQPGQTLTEIAEYYYGSSSTTLIERIMYLNQMKDPQFDVQSYMELKIPDPVQWVHLVQEGENLYRISLHYFGTGQYQDEIAALNEINVPENELYAGMLLNIQEPGHSLAQNEETHHAEASTGRYQIEINTDQHALTVHKNGNAIITFPVATGADPSLTPTGTFEIANKVKDPWYIPEDIPGGDPANPLGDKWLGLDVPGTDGYKYGIHGTNDPASIGTDVSLGCIRMYNDDIQWLYEHVPLSTKVHIH